MNKTQFKEELKQCIRNAKTQVKEFDHKYPLAHSYDNLVTRKNYINLIGLQEFIKLHAELSDDEIVSLINENARTFKFLKLYIDYLPDGIDKLRTQGHAIPAMVFEAQFHSAQMQNKQ